MEVWKLPIAASYRAKLVYAGYSSLSSLSSISPYDLARELHIADNEACEILKAASNFGGNAVSAKSPAIVTDKGIGCGGLVDLVSNYPKLNTFKSWPGAQTAWDMLHEEDSARRITTSCADLDNILGGGINCKEVTEIGGVPGIGKTQFGIQLAVNVQIPAAYGGLGGKAVYIDTEGSFMVERALQMAEACVEDMSEYQKFVRKNFQAGQVQMQPKNFLENMFYFRICSYTEQIAVINYLDNFISGHKDVKVVIIDSITFHFRQDFDDMALRTRLLSGMALKLLKLSKKYSLSVVILNQATTKYSEGSYHLTLALGDSWSHSCTNRVILYWNGDERYAYIDKSPSLRSASAPYAVTGKGIRDSSSKHKRIKTVQVSS